MPATDILSELEKPGRKAYAKSTQPASARSQPAKSASPAVGTFGALLQDAAKAKK